MRLASRRVLGELEHPESGNTHLERVSHLILDAWIEHLDETKIKNFGLDESVKPGDYVLGKYEILNTPKGQILRALHEAQVSVGVSSRGRGDIRQVDGIDEVCDDYDLDTWDAVYLPSVVEARPGNIHEADAKNLGSALPDASKGVKSDVTPTNTQPDDSWKREAEEIIRALETCVSTSALETVDMVEILPRGVNLIDQLSSITDPEAIKLKSQALTLIRVLTNKIMDKETGGVPRQPGEPKPEKKASEKKPDSEKKEKPEKEEKPEKKEKEKKEEGTLKDLATTTAAQKKKEGGVVKPMFKGDLESILNKAGHQPDDTKVRELANELKAQGVDTQPDKYESLTEATKEKLDHLQDGQIVQASAKKLLKDSEGQVKPEVQQFLEKQDENEVLIRVCSKGSNGYVVRLLEPGFGESNIFVKFDGVKEVKLESVTEGDSEMKAKEMLEKAVKEIEQLKKDLEGAKSGSDSVPKIRYEAAKKLISGLTERVKAGKGVPEARYQAAKKLIAGLVEKVKTLEQEKLHESNRVKAATKLIHKIVSEKKVKKDDKKDDKKDKKDDKKKDEAQAPEAKPEVKPEVKETVEPKKPSSIDEAVRTASKVGKEEVVEKPVVTEAKKEEAPKQAITNESQELIRRIHGIKPEVNESKKPVSTGGLMGAIAARVG